MPAGKFTASRKKKSVDDLAVLFLREVENIGPFLNSCLSACRPFRNYNIAVCVLTRITNSGVGRVWNLVRCGQWSPSVMRYP